MIPGFFYNELGWLQAEIRRYYPARQLLHVPEGIQTTQGGPAEAFGTTFSGVAAAALDGLAVGFEPLVDHGPAAEYNPLSKVPDPSCQDFCCQTPFIGRSELGPDFF